MTYTVTSSIVANTPFTLQPAEGTIAQAGTPLSAANLNKLETQYDEVVALAQMTKLTLDTGYGSSVSNTDLNSLITTGFYFGTNVTNPPISGDTGTYRIFVEASSSVNCGQLATKLSTGQRFSRIMTTTNTWTPWIEFVTDKVPTWTNLTLTGGAIVYSSGVTTPQYTKIGSVVYIQGAIKNLSTVGVTVATLPSGFRPSQSVSFSLPTSGSDHARWTINSAGAMVMENTTSGTTNTSSWFPMTMSFVSA
jgi:hypothetical protein